jgi:HD-like signal output (HDOD) protein
MDAWKSRWGAPQWAAFFENQALPVMPGSKLALTELEASQGEMLSPKDLLAIVLQDPMLCLCLMREAERRKSHRLDHETTTALAAILQLGVDEFRKLLLSSPEIDQSNLGLLKVGERARIASQVAQVWAVGRMDINPEEVAVAALLAGCGDLLLWVYAPEIPEKAEKKLANGRAKRSAEAQVLACGFTFKDLTLQCAERWKLPALVIQLLRGSDSERAQLTRVCSNTARHLLDESGTANLALATDLVEVIELIPNASLEWLVDGLQMLPEARRLALLDKANEFLLEMPPPP